MPFSLYDHGRDQLADWETADYLWLLMKSGSFDPTDAVVDDLAAGELTVPAYARVAPDTPTRTVNTTLHRTEYTIGADPDFGDLTVSPEDATALVLVRVVTDDTDSIPVCWGSFGTPRNTSSLNPFVPHVTDLLVAIND